MTDYSAWVREGQQVEARYASYDGIHARGWVYAYSDKPTLHLVQPDGSELTWHAELCVPVGAASNEARNAALERRDRAAAVVPYLESEVAFWREKAESLQVKIKQIAKLDPLLPPEPPIGTEYVNERGVVVWVRREDGWHCMRPDDECRNCPCEWNEAWDFGIASDGNTRRLPRG